MSEIIYGEVPTISSKSIYVVGHFVLNLHCMIPIQVNLSQTEKASLEPMTCYTHKFELICNECLCGRVEIKLDYKVTDQV